MNPASLLDREARERAGRDRLVGARAAIGFWSLPAGQVDCPLCAKSCPPRNVVFCSTGDLGWYRLGISPWLVHLSQREGPTRDERRRKVFRGFSNLEAQLEPALDS